MSASTEELLDRIARLEDQVATLEKSLFDKIAELDKRFSTELKTFDELKTVDLRRFTTYYDSESD